MTILLPIVRLALGAALVRAMVKVEPFVP